MGDGNLVMVVDDDRELRESVCELLAEGGYSALGMANGAAALSYIKEQQPKPKVILLDLMMPEMNGWQFREAQLGDPSISSIPVVVMTAGRDLGGIPVEDVVYKPLSLELLLDVVRRHETNEQSAERRSQHVASGAVPASLVLGRLDEVANGAVPELIEDNGAGVKRLLEEAWRATRHREEILAVVSHDLRSPLGAISAVADLLQRTLEMPDPQRSLQRQAEIIHRCVKRMDRLIGDLLDLASIDSGSLALDARPHTLDLLGQEASEAFQPQAVQHHVTFATEVADRQAQAQCDKERILQVLSNLVSNALKVTPEGGSIRLDIAPEPGGEMIRFSVTDTGPGICPAEREHLFDRWRTGPRTPGGHGLGLSISKGIVEAHGGTFEVQSEVGRGSTFSFLIPAGPVRHKNLTLARLVEGTVAEQAQQPFPRGGGEMGALMRSMDWSRHPLGPVEAWPSALRSVVQAMLDAKLSMLVAWGPDSRCLYNDAYRSVLSGGHPDALGRPFAEISGQAWERARAMFARARAGETLAQDDEYCPLEEGDGLEDRYITFSMSPLRDDTGNIAGTLGVLTDTTARVEAQRRLVTLRDLARELAGARNTEEVCTAAVQVLSQNSVDLPFLLAYRLDEDARRGELLARVGLDAHHPAAPASVALDAAEEEGGWPLSQALHTSQTVTPVSDVRARFGDLPGGPYPESPRSAKLLKLGRGAERPLGVLVAGINPRRAVDDDYRLFLELVADQIGSRLANVRAFEEERRRASSLAEIDQTKTAFLRNVSHELRTPLTLILEPLKQIMQSGKQTLAGDNLELVWGNALRLQHMVDSLLDFSQVSAGLARARFVPTDLCALTTDITSEFRSAVEHAGLELTMSCDDLPGPVYVDPELWEKIVLNLLSNALKYTLRGAIRVSVSGDGEHAVLTVKDTGVGIPEDELPQVLQRFFRSRLSEARSHEGTGIGLALVQELVKLHGGQVTVQSRVGEGSTFTVRMQLGCAHLAPELVDTEPRPRASQNGASAYLREALHWAGSNGAGKTARSNTLAQPEHEPRASAERPPESVQIADARILLVDDNEDLRKYVKRLLERSFHHVEAASDGRAALELARETPPDLILSDVMMPGLDGFELIRKLREQDETRQVPIVLLSAHAGEEATVEGLQAGADDYLTKPYSARELLARVTVHLRMAMVRREAAEHRAKEQALRRMLEEKDEFLTLASHEFRTPLTTISLQADGLIRLLSEPTSLDGQAPRLRRRAEMVRVACSRLDEIIDSLLNVLVLNDRVPFTSVQDVDVNAIAGDVLSRFRHTMGQTGAMLSLEGSGPLVGRYDKEAIERILSNLLSNAVKFGEHKPVTISLTGDENVVRISVRDSGIGIDPKDHCRIFERFGRAVSKNQYGGLGLGLWVVRRLTEALHGIVRVESEPGEGSKFTVELPRAPG